MRTTVGSTICHVVGSAALMLGLFVGDKHVGWFVLVQHKCVRCNMMCIAGMQIINVTEKGISKFK